MTFHPRHSKEDYFTLYVYFPLHYITSKMLAGGDKVVSRGIVDTVFTLYNRLYDRLQSVYALSRL